MDALVEIAGKAIADYGFRQIALWSPDDIVAEWGLSPAEADVLHGPLHRALGALPVPVEPADVPGETERLAAIIEDALSS